MRTRAWNIFCYSVYAVAIVGNLVASSAESNWRYLVIAVLIGIGWAWHVVAARYARITARYALLVAGYEQAVNSFIEDWFSEDAS